MDPLIQLQDAINRRTFLKGGAGLGLTALFTLMGSDAFGFDGFSGQRKRIGGIPTVPHFKPKAKRVIYLHQSGAPSQMDLFDPKPELDKFRGQDLPESIRNGQRLTGMTSGQKSFPCVAPMFQFQQHGQSGAWVSNLLPNISRIVDDVAFVTSDILTLQAYF